MPRHFVAGEGALFAQVGGPNTALEYLGCHLLGDVDKAEGDIEIIWCPDPSRPNAFLPAGQIVGAGGGPTTTLTTDVTDEFDALEEQRCPFVLYVNLVPSGRKDNFGNGVRTFAMTQTRITNRGWSNLAARSPDDNARSEQSYDLSGEDFLALVQSMAAARQTISEAENILDVTFCNEANCATESTAYQLICQEGYAVAEAGTDAAANVLRTTNGGTWAATAADPFGNNEDISAVECFDMGGGAIRVVVARGTTDAGAPAEISYTDDGGATWTNVTVGSVNGTFVASPNAMFALDSAHLWVGLSDGYIYFSEDSGLTWEAQETGVIHAADWLAIDFATTDIGWAGGEANVIARTLDGGVSWEEISGPGAQAAAHVVTVVAIDRYRAWVGYSDGELWYTMDGGVNWSQRTFSGSGVGTIKVLKFYNELVGVMLREDGSGNGAAMVTITGGTQWKEITLPAGTLGLNGLHFCSQRQLFLAGDAVGGSGMIARVAM